MGSMNHHRSFRRINFMINFIVWDLVLGISIGVLFGMMTLNFNNFIRNKEEELIRIPFSNGSNQTQYIKELPDLNISLNTNTSNNTNLNILEESVAEKLKNEIRILCWVLTSPKNHLKRALHIKNTWGTHCNILLFMSTVEDPVLHSVALNISDGRKYLWGKTKLAINYIYKHYLYEADWFVKADDDTFIVVENLRYFLQNHSTSNPIYFGCRFKPYVKQGYMSGGAGYVMSRGAIKRFVEIALVASLGHLCKKNNILGTEDVQLGRCLQAVGVKAGDSIDSRGGHRFLPLRPQTHLTYAAFGWYKRYIWSPQPKGLECCSDTAISFHYIRTDKMYVMNYLVYSLRRENMKMD